MTTKSNPFQLHALFAALPGLIARGEFTATTLLDIWHCDATMKHYPIWSSRDDVPSDVQDMIGHAAVGAEASAMLAAWSPNYGIPQPAIVRWILKTEENRALFEALDFDRAAFVRELLAHPFYGRRMRFDGAQHPYFLGFLPEEERWQLLETFVREYGTAIDWSWPSYAAHAWSRPRTRQLVRCLIKEPELAGAFLAAEDAHRGWLAFWDDEEFLDVLADAGARAPYELLSNREWIATCLGDRRTNPRSFMDPADPEADDPWYGWWMLPNEVQVHFGPLGQSDLAMLIDQSFERALARPREELSDISQAFVEKLNKLSLKPESPPTRSEEVVDLLGYFPDCAFARALFGQLFVFETSQLGVAYRWLFNGRHWRLSRVRRHVFGAHEQHVEIKDWPSRVRGSWFETAFREHMISRGWRFRAIEIHRNERFREGSDRGYDPQVKLVENGVTHVYTVWRGHWSSGDYTLARPLVQGQRPQEVMIPPDFNPGDPFFVNSAKNFYLYNVGQRLLLAGPLSDDQRPPLR